MKLLPRSHTGQLALLLFVALFIAQTLAFVLFASERIRAARFAYQENILARTATLVRLLDDTPAAMQDRILDAASTRLVRFSRGPEPIAGPAQGRMAIYLEREFGEALKLPAGEVRTAIVRDAPARPFWHGFGKDGPREHWREHDGPPLSLEERREIRDRHLRFRRRHGPVTWVNISIRLRQGDWLNLVAGPPPGPPPFGRAFLASLLLSAAATGLVALLVGRRISRPLRGLADAAERFGRGETFEPLAEEGPDEARRSARAFNEMRERLDRFVSDRTRMLAAISHDLRTPITSLRLRAELVDDAEMRDRLIETIEEMQEMTEAALAFARADRGGEETRQIDLAALVESLVEDLAELGQTVEMAEGPAPVVRCRAGEIKRAVRNVVENAVRYGGSARVRIETAGNEVWIVVEDDGPGIAEADLERVFEPFVRLEPSRSRETGGVGLGLAIARSLLRGHGGDVTLENRAGGGLKATLSLPV